MDKLKMNTLLAKVDQEQKGFAITQQQTATRLRDQKSFLGEKKTYSPRDGYPEDPSKMGTKRVATTVTEVLKNYIHGITPYLKDLFAVEATNSKGAKTVELVVDGKSFGHLTALELMRLKSVLQNEVMAGYIPTRSDSEVWTPTSDEDYKDREVFETPMLKGVTRTTESEVYVLRDPNLDPQHIPSGYRPETTTKKRTVEIGDYTSQKFSGEWNQKQAADAQHRKAALLTAVIAALKEVNDQEADEARLNVPGILDYIYFGK